MSDTEDDSKQLQQWLKRAYSLGHPWRPLLLWSSQDNEARWSDDFYASCSIRNERPRVILQTCPNAYKLVLMFTANSSAAEVFCQEDWEPSDDVQRQP